MKSLVLFFLFQPFSICAQSQERFEIHPGLRIKISADRRLAYPVHDNQMIYYKSKGIRAAIIITKINNASAEYKARVFLTKERTESMLEGSLEEVYEKEQMPNGEVELIDKGSHLTIKLKDDSLQWSFGGKGMCYVYTNVDEAELFILDAAYFEDCMLSDEKPDKDSR